MTMAIPSQALEGISSREGVETNRWVPTITLYKRPAPNIQLGWWDSPILKETLVNTQENPGVESSILSLGKSRDVV